MAPATPPTKPTLTVPAKPALISAVNSSVLVGSVAWVAAGPVGLAVGAALAGGSVLAVRKVRGSRRSRAQSASDGSSGRRGLFGRSRAPGLGGASPDGRRRGMLGRLAGRQSKAVGSDGGGSRSGATASGKPRRGLFGKKAAGRAGSGRGGGPAGPAAAGKAGGPKGAYRKLRGWTRRNILGHRPAASAGSRKPCITVPKATVLRPTQTPKTQPPTAAPQVTKPGTPVPVPATAIRTTKGPSMSASSSNTGGLLAHARQMFAYTATYEPRGMRGPVEPGGDLHDLSESLGWIRAAVGQMSEKASAKWPMDPAVSQALSRIVQNLDAAAVCAREVKPAVEAMHKNELERLRQPRPGEDKWDVEANR